MPEVNMMAPGTAEAAYIYWRNPGGAPIGHAQVGELFMGLTNRLELDVDGVWPSSMLDNVFEVNAYYKVCKEIPRKRPAITIGATNIFSQQWLPSNNEPPPAGDKRVSPFAIAAMTLHAPQGGPPTWSDPAVRLQVGYGTNYHEDQLFGILQAAFTPNIFAGIMSYQGATGYLAGWDNGKGLSAAIGTLGSDNGWFHISYDFSTNLH